MRLFSGRMASPATYAPATVKSGRVAAFLEHFGGAAGENPVKAAELAGYPDPRDVGPRLARRYRQELERRAAERKAKAQASEDEMVERLSAIVRDPTHKDHLKAVELGLRMYGKLSDKAQVEEGKTNIVRELRMLLESAVRVAKGSPSTSLPNIPQAQIIEAQTVESPAPGPGELGGDE